MNEGLAQDIIDTLCDHKGFDNWWYDLEDEIQAEILEELEEVIRESEDDENGE